MLIHQFRKFTPINIAILCAIGIVLSIFVYQTGISIHSENLFGNFIHDYFFPNWNFHISSIGSHIITFVIIMFQALFVNKICNEYKILGNPNFLVALVYFILSFFVLSVWNLSPILISNFIMIYILYRLLKLYHIEKAYFSTFDLGFLIGISSIIYLPSIFNFLTIWMALSIFRPFNWREWVTPLIGLGTVYFLSWVFGFWNDILGKWTVLGLQFSELNPFVLPEFQFNNTFYFPLASLAILFFFFLFVLKDNFYKRIVHVRKSIQLMFGILLVNFLSYFIQNDPDSTHFILCVPVLSVYLGYYFYYAEKKWFYESLFLLLLLSIVYVNVV